MKRKGAGRRALLFLPLLAITCRHDKHGDASLVKPGSGSILPNDVIFLPAAYRRQRLFLFLSLAGLRTGSLSPSGRNAHGDGSGFENPRKLAVWTTLQIGCRNRFFIADRLWFGRVIGQGFDAHETYFRERTIARGEDAVRLRSVGQAHVIREGSVGSRMRALALCGSRGDVHGLDGACFSRPEPFFDDWRIVPTLASVACSPEAEEELLFPLIHHGLKQQVGFRIVDEFKIRRRRVNGRVGSRVAVLGVVIVGNHERVVAAFGNVESGIHDGSEGGGADLAESSADFWNDLVALDDEFGEIAVFGREGGERV